MPQGSCAGGRRPPRFGGAGRWMTAIAGTCRGGWRTSRWTWLRAACARARESMPALRLRAKGAGVCREAPTGAPARRTARLRGGAFWRLPRSCTTGRAPCRRGRASGPSTCHHRASRCSPRAHLPEPPVDLRRLPPEVPSLALPNVVGRHFNSRVSAVRDQRVERVGGQPQTLTDLRAGEPHRGLPHGRTWAVATSPSFAMHPPDGWTILLMRRTPSMRHRPSRGSSRARRSRPTGRRRSRHAGGETGRAPGAPSA